MEARVLKVMSSASRVGERDDVLHLDHRDRGCVIFAHDSTRNSGGLVSFSEKELERKGFTRKLQDFIKEMSLKASPNSIAWEWKALGCSESLKTARSVMSELGLKLAKEKCDDIKSFEIYFHAADGRLRIAESGELPKIELKVTGKRKVLIIDDSKTIQTLLSRVFSKDSRLEVVGVVGDPREADKKIQELQPDIITLDIRMPHIDGVTLLKQIGPKYKIPVVMISSIRKEEGPEVLEALEYGAIDFIQKPGLEELDQVAQSICDKIYDSSLVRRQEVAASVNLSKQFLKPVALGEIDLTRKVVAIGSSTGGTDALRQILERLPAKIPAMIIVQHIPAVFSAAFAERLNKLCPFEVKEAADGDQILPNRVLIAPGGFHMAVDSTGGQLIVRILDTPAVNRFKPSVDVLFDSVAEKIGRKAVGIMLTGMGADGAKGMLKMRKAGARTLGQDEASSVVYGMPKAAFEAGAVEKQCSLQAIPDELWKLLS